MDIVVNANNFPIYTINNGAAFEPLFLPPDGTRIRYCIGWNGVGRYTPGTLLIWRKGVSLKPGTDFIEESNGIFFSFATAPSSTDQYSDYLISFIPRTDDIAFSSGTGEYSGEEYFLFPNWMELPGCGDAFWIGKYLASRNTSTATGEGTGTVPVSKQGVIPWATITFTLASSVTNAKGNGFHVTRNREWMNIAFWCQALGIYPNGNTVSGVDGIGVSGTPDSTCSGRCLTGTGPITWNHNLRHGGIADMVGNIWECVDGIQLVNGTLWIFDSNNALINTGIAPTFGTSANAFSLLRTDDSIKNEGIPASGNGTAVKGSDGFWFTTSGTNVLYRGVSWHDGSLGGLFAFYVAYPASYSNTTIGFRLCKTLI